MAAEPSEHDLVELIAAHADRYRGELDVVERLVHGSSDPLRIARQLSAFVREHFGVGVRGGLFHQASAGSVTGVVLEDGRPLVIKAYQPTWSPPFLRALVEAQQALVSAGLPCAPPLLAPSPTAVRRRRQSRICRTPASRTISATPKCGPRPKRSP